MGSDLVSVAGQFLHGRVVGVPMRHEEGALDGAAVRVQTVGAEQLLVDVDVVDGDGIVEGDHDHLRRLRGAQVAWNSLAGRRAETFRQLALDGIARLGAVRIFIHGYKNRHTTMFVLVQPTNCR